MWNIIVTIMIVTQTRRIRYRCAAILSVLTPIRLAVAILRQLRD